MRCVLYENDFTKLKNSEPTELSTSLSRRVSSDSDISSAVSLHNSNFSGDAKHRSVQRKKIYIYPPQRTAPPISYDERTEIRYELSAHAAEENPIYKRTRAALCQRTHVHMPSLIKLTDSETLVKQSSIPNPPRPKKKKTRHRNPLPAARALLFHTV